MYTDQPRLTGADPRSVSIKTECCVASACLRRTLEAYAVIIKFLDYRPASTCFLLKNAVQPDRIAETSGSGTQNLELPILSKVLRGIGGHFFFLLLSRPGGGCGREGAAPALMVPSSVRGTRKNLEHAGRGNGLKSKHF